METVQQLEDWVIHGKPGVRKAMMAVHHAIQSQDYIWLPKRGIGSKALPGMSVTLMDILISGPLRDVAVHATYAHHPGGQGSCASYTMCHCAPRADVTATLATLPAGAIATAPALHGELVSPAGRGRMDRWRWQDGQWQRRGVILRCSRKVWTGKALDTVRYWEHGDDDASCRAEADRKSAIARGQYLRYCQSNRAERRAQLIARLCTNLRVDYATARAAGACKAGIEAFAQSKGLTLDASVPITDLARDPRAAWVALAVARQVVR